MICIRGVVQVLVLLSGLLAWGLDGFSGESIPPPAPRGSLAVERPAPVRPSSVGVQEISRPDGGQDIIYYSVTPPEEKSARQQAEIQKQEKSLELLNNAIIIKR